MPIDNVEADLPPPEFPGVAEGVLPPGATHTGYIPSGVPFQVGDRFVFAVTGSKIHRPYVVVGDIVPDMVGQRIAITLPMWFIEAHTGNEVRAFYFVQYLTGSQAYSHDTVFAVGHADDAPITPRWFTANFEEFSLDQAIIPKRMAFLELVTSVVPRARAFSNVPYCTGMAYYLRPNELPSIALDFTARRVRCGVRASATYPVTISLLNGSGAVLVSKKMNASGWFDELVEKGGITSIKIDGPHNYIDNVFVFPDRADEEAARHPSENFDGLPHDDGHANTFRIPAWHVSAASSTIAVEAAASGSTSHALVIHQLRQNNEGEMLHYFTPRAAYRPSRVALSLRAEPGYSQNARICAMYQKLDMEADEKATDPPVFDDAPRYVCQVTTLNATMQTVELGGVRDGEFLSCLYVEQTAGRANRIFYDEIIAT